jgi:CRISPR-associated endonuclease/helicase Cas3
LAPGETVNMIASKTSTRFWAHSDPNTQNPTDPGANWQPLADHLRQVASKAEAFALAAGASREQASRAKAAGLLHDLGKYRDDFQKLLRGEVKKAPHSIFGAIPAFAKKAYDVAFAVAGHHAGLPDRTRLKERLADANSDVEPLWARAIEDCPELALCFDGPDPLLKNPKPYEPNLLDCQIRMLFSCLIDADRLDTAAHYGELPPQFPPLDAAPLLEKLLRAIRNRAAEVPDGPVKQARNAVLDACLAAAERKGPLFSLTVPTGGAKTLAAMAFALRRAALMPKRTRRIIVVVPFLSIIDQNAKVYRDALGGEIILEHHSNAWSQNESDDGPYANPSHQFAAENWDAPIIITTAVRFFESLFSNRPRDLRRMHNIARSTVILDEVQTVPRELVKPILAMVQSLSQDWSTTFVFSTATQPAFERHPSSQGSAASGSDGRWAPGTLDEIVPDPPALFAVLRRVAVQWPTAGATRTWASIADDVRRERQALIIVNTRKNARELYDLLAGDGALHLSNSMCPRHRLSHIAEIKVRLTAGEPCIVVATQLVEAGVDLDFPAVWRATGPLEAIAQAAGRCDREGRLTLAAGHPAGRVVVFNPEKRSIPKGAYLAATDLTAAMASTGLVDIDDPNSIRKYYDQFYNGSLDPQGIEELRKIYDFPKVADRFKLIDDLSCPVIVPYDDNAKELLEKIQFSGGGSLKDLRQLQSYTVNLAERDFKAAVQKQILVRVSDDREIWRCPEGLYDKQHIGINLEPGKYVGTLEGCDDATLSQSTT